jgi:hypothetical protein
MITLEEAKAKSCCRICGEPISLKKEMHHDTLNEQVSPTRIVLRYGKEYAHYNCLNKCIICGKPLLENAVPFSDLNDSLFRVTVGPDGQWHEDCRESRGAQAPIDLINTAGQLIWFVERYAGNKMKVQLFDGRQYHTPILEVVKDDKGEERLIIRK